MTGTALHGGWAAPEPQAAGEVRWMESSRAYVVPLGPAGVGDRREGHELRIALAMKGGVSLAVWIGGAVTELDLLRRAMQPDDVHPEQPPVGLSRDEWGRALAYRERVLALGYTSVKIDVLAGASAGGLNAAIYGFAQSVGLSLNWMLGVWERNGDIMELFHPAWVPGTRLRTEAIFDADANFYGPLRDQLTALYGDPTPGALGAPPTDFFTVDLSATLADGPPLPELAAPDGRPPRPDLRPRTAHFRFRGTPAVPGPFNHFPAPADAKGDLRSVDESVRRVAYAARSTSSFPGAFEPATNRSWRGPASGPPREERNRLPRNMAEVFSEVGTSSATPFMVMDGGVFDNIPIARALRAIDDAPATAASKRILIYLDPSPESPVPPPRTSTGDPSDDAHRPGPCSSGPLRARSRTRRPRRARGTICGSST